MGAKNLCGTGQDMDVDEELGFTESEVKIHGTDERLHRIRDDPLSRLSPGVDAQTLALAHTDVIDDAEPLADRQEILSVDDGGSPRGQPALVAVLVFAVQMICHRELEDGVSKELEKLVVLLGRRILVQIRAMCQSRRQLLFVLELDPEFALDLLNLAIENIRQCFLLSHCKRAIQELTKNSHIVNPSQIIPLKLKDDSQKGSRLSGARDELTDGSEIGCYAWIRNTQLLYIAACMQHGCMVTPHEVADSWQ